MFLFRRPSVAEIADWLVAQRRLPFSYADVGDLGRLVPRGYDCDRHRVRLGTGPETFAAACDALAAWEHFPARMARVVPADVELAAGNDVAVLFHAGFAWSLNACRIVESIDERDERRARFGFTYGTLAGHIEHGEERFLIEHDLIEDSVWYELFCFSRPQHPLAHLGRPIVRHQQARFRRLSGEALRRAVAERLAGTKVEAPR
ncbi:MAG: DUF1990 domain-containing protein [Planctomycetales bacterium]